MSHEKTPDPVRVTGISPFVINATVGIATWTFNQTQSTPIATLTVTNPSTTKPLRGMVSLYHGLYASMANPASENPKNSALSAQGVVSLDDGAGVLQNPVLYPAFLGSSQIVAQAVRHDAGMSNAGAGNQTQHVNLLPISIAPGATVTFRSQSTLTVHDGDTQGTIWTYNRMLFDGMVYP